MKPLKINPTNKTPLIEYNDGIFNIIGRSIPEVALDFYRPVIEWIESYIENPDDKLIINVKLDFFSTQSSKHILYIFKRFETLGKDKVRIIWYYDDPDIEESGVDFSLMCGLDFEFVLDEDKNGDI